MPQWTLAPAFGAIVGAVCGLLLVAGHPRVVVLPLAAAVVAASAYAGSYLPWAALPGALFATGAIAAASIPFALVVLVDAVRSRRSRGSTLRLTDEELRRRKAAGDAWILVIGPPRSGKSALVDIMVHSGERDEIGDFRLAGAALTGERGGNRVTELPIEAPGGRWQLRFWETHTLPASHDRALPPFADFDAVIVVLDPTQLEGIADSFPDVLRASSEAIDGNTLLLQVADAARAASRRVQVWAVLTKCDLLRLSVYTPLVEFPIQVGPGWYRQLAMMFLPVRRDLLHALGLPHAVEPTSAFDWGRGSPSLVYSRSDSPMRPFGGPELMRELLDELLAPASVAGGHG